MKIDFIHIGLHKTASTYLQSSVFPRISNLNMANKDHDSWFYDEFIKVNPHKFDSHLFLEKFKRKVDLSKNNKSCILGISEENLSGDLYSGQCSKELMLRIKECFGDTKILIVLRNPVDYVLSIYGNYILNGGTKNIKNWFFGEETRFGEVIEKLHYSFLVEDYINTFGGENVSVVLYEKLHDKNNGILDFFKIFDLNYFEMSSGKANVGRSLKANNVMSYFNFFNVKFKGFQKIFSFLSPSEQDREKVKMLMTPYHKSLNKDNTKLSTLLKIKLPEIYYL